MLSSPLQGVDLIFAVEAYMEPDGDPPNSNPCFSCRFLVEGLSILACLIAYPMPLEAVLITFEYF